MELEPTATSLGAAQAPLSHRTSIAPYLTRFTAATAFRVPSDFTRVFAADLAVAGIAKTDARGRTLDIHCLRHTFATLLARNGASPSVAEKLLRHSDIRLTMNIYTHLDLADTAGAVAALPMI